MITIFLINQQTDLHCGCKNFHSHQQWRSTSLVQHPSQCELSLLLLTLAILTEIRWNLKVHLICISLITKIIELFFKRFSNISIFLYCEFSIYTLGLLLWNFWDIYIYIYMLNISPQSDERPWKGAANWLVSHSMLSLPSKDYQHTYDTTHNGLDSPLSVTY